MKLDTSLYLPYQRELDERIFVTHNTTRALTQRDRLLAFCVELSEFVNETRCFKYWSLKPASEHSILLEEFADGMHFLNSLCIDLNMTPVFEVTETVTSLTELTLQVMQASSQCIDALTEASLSTLYEKYLTLGKACGFTSDMLFDSYLKKHQKNHVRQDEHY